MRISYLLLICLVLLLSCKKDKISINSDDVIGHYCGMILEDVDSVNFQPIDYFIDRYSREGEFFIEKIDKDILLLKLPPIFKHTDSLIFENRVNDLLIPEQSFKWIDYCGSGCIDTVTEYYSGFGTFYIDESKLYFQIFVSWRTWSGKEYNVPISIEMIKFYY